MQLISKFLILILLNLFFSTHSFSQDGWYKVTVIHIESGKKFKGTAKERSKAIERANLACKLRNKNSVDLCFLSQVKIDNKIENFSIPESKKVQKISKNIAIENFFEDAPTKDDSGKFIYYFFAYTSDRNIFYGWTKYNNNSNYAYPEYIGNAKFLNLNNNSAEDDCLVKSIQTKTSSPHKGKFEMKCPNNISQNVDGNWKQTNINEPGIGFGKNNAGQKIFVFFSNSKNTINTMVDGSLNILDFNFNQEKKFAKKKSDLNKIVPAGSGSGFLVSRDGVIITNYHVIDSCELNKVSYKGSEFEAKVISVDKANDIAILKTKIIPEKFLTISNDDVGLLEDVVVAGFPLGKQISSAIKTHKGVVTALAGAGDNYSLFQTDAAINQGNSGGPILDQKGNVVGIAVATWVEEGVQGVHFGIKSSTLKSFANANGIKFLPANKKDLSNKVLGKIISQSTVYLECHMTLANIKKMIAESENRKAFFKEYQ